MNIFNLIFLAVFLTFVLLLVIAVIAIMDRHQTRLRRVLQQLGFLVGIYLSILILVSIYSPQKILNAGDPQCSNGWCIAVEDVRRTYTDSLLSCTVTLRISNHPRSSKARSRNRVSISIIDNQGRYYNPDENPNAVPFNTLLQPGESVLTNRKFMLPKDANNLCLVINHSKFPNMLVIGNEQSLFHKRTVIRLN